MYEAIAKIDRYNGEEKAETKRLAERQRGGDYDMAGFGRELDEWATITNGDFTGSLKEVDVQSRAFRILRRRAVNAESPEILWRGTDTDGCYNSSSRYVRDTMPPPIVYIRNGVEVKGRPHQANMISTLENVVSLSEDMPTNGQAERGLVSDP